MTSTFYDSMKSKNGTEALKKVIFLLFYNVLLRKWILKEINRKRKF